MPTPEQFSSFGARCFDDRSMKKRLSPEIYEQLRQIRDEGKEWVPQVADAVAGAMRDWAIEYGATHYVHWFTPMTGASAGKHDSFIDGVENGSGRALIRFSGNLLSKGESDASSFPSGGLRTTFEARGYTTWDPTSPAFVLGTTLYIPTAFCGYNGQALDQKTPLLRSMQAVGKQALRLLRALGDTHTLRVAPTVGAEQEYFLVDKSLLDMRLDLKVCGTTLAGARPPKGQELEDHYYGSVSERVRDFMRELDEELWRIGVPAKTEHNETAPGQYELASVYASANVALDHNQITMELLRKVALRHGFACLLHEKPFAGVNGNGKHNNWSLTTNEGVNLLDPGDNPVENRVFLLTLCAVIAAVDDYADLIRLSAACPGNDLRLGSHEAPPAILSIFLGDKLTSLLENLAAGQAYEMGRRDNLLTGVRSLPLLERDDNDRNRTSPFAFTGNKFEFRMVGASQSIGLANALLGAAVADKLAGFADALEEAPPGGTDACVAALVHQVWEAHGKRIYNGNNYSAQWVREAARRGLEDIPGTVQAAGALVTDKNRAMLERTKVFTPDECHSRYEVMLDGYSKTMRIAARTLLDMARRSYLPAACGALQDAAQTAAAANGEAGRAHCAYAGRLAGVLAGAIDACAAAADKLDTALAATGEAGHGPLAADAADSTLAQAQAMQAVAHGEMAALRAACDALEALVPENRWPVPGYSDLLYDI